MASGDASPPTAVCSSPSIAARWTRERWPAFGLAFGLVLVGWLLLGVLPWWSLLLVVFADAGWSVRRGDWSLAAFLAGGAGVVAATAALVSLLP